MSDILKKTLELLTGTPSAPKTSTQKVSKSFFTIPKNRPLKSLTERELLNLESKIGAEIFGELPKGRRREFFCLDASTWIWHEAWKEKSTEHETTVRYEVHDNGVLKVQDGARYEFIEGEELRRFMTAVQMYYERVAREVYGRDPVSGQKVEEK